MVPISFPSSLNVQYYHVSKIRLGLVLKFKFKERLNTWNKVKPKINSNRIQPILQTSQGWDHPNSNITSGAL
jgi:hypothetical protein